MKFDLRATIVLIVVIAITIWAVNLIRPRSYSGDELTFGFSGGAVTVTNPSDVAVPVEVRGTGSRTFTLSSNVDGVGGRSTRDGSGRTSTQIFAFDLPAGTTEFTVVNGTETTFSTASDTELSARVQPVAAGTARTTIIALVIAIIGALFYMSSTMQHRWIALLRGEKFVPVAAKPAMTSAEAHGTPTKSFGDNISRKSD